MPLHFFSGWPDSAYAEAGHTANWTTTLNPAHAIRRPVTIRAELPPLRVEGQTERRWRGAPII